MIAANDDPVLAAWAAVSLEHGVVCVSDTSPHDVWEAYQVLYNYDCISPEAYNESEHLLFSKTPMTGAVQEVLSRVNSHQYSKENQMSNNDSFNPFATNNSIARRPEPRGNSQIQSRSRQALDNPFATEAPAAAIEARPREGELSGDFFGQPKSGLPCHDMQPNNSTATSIDGQTYTPDVRCCQVPVSMTEVERVGSDGGSNIGSQLTLAVFEGVCRECGFIHHNSVGRMADPGAFR